MNSWIILTIIYAILVSFTEVSKKKALKNNTIYEVLFWFNLISFIFSVFITKDTFTISYNYLFLIFIKSSLIFITWILGLKALGGLELSVYGLIKISRIVFSVVLSCILLGEKVNISTFIGVFIVIIGIILVTITSTNNTDNKKNNSLVLIFIFSISCLGSSISAIMDKHLLKNISSGQLQFWFLFFLVCYYFITLIIKNKKINIKYVKTNYWIILVSIFSFIADRCLFIANENPSSKVIVMSIIKQLSIIFSVILGKIFFDEKNIIRKLMYSFLIIMGVIIIII